MNVAVIIGLSVLSICVLAGALLWRKKKREQKQQYEQRVKQEALDKALKNNYAVRETSQIGQKAESVESMLNRKEDAFKPGTIVVKPTVMGREEKSYVVNPENPVSIGNEEYENDIVLKGREIAPLQGKVFLFEGRVYIKNQNSDGMIKLVRKRNQIQVANRGIRILTGDQIWLGDVRLWVTLMDYVGNTIPG